MKKKRPGRCGSEDERRERRSIEELSSLSLSCTVKERKKEKESNQQLLPFEKECSSLVLILIPLSQFFSLMLSPQFFHTLFLLHSFTLILEFLLLSIKRKKPRNRGEISFGHFSFQANRSLFSLSLFCLSAFPLSLSLFFFLSFSSLSRTTFF